MKAAKVKKQQSLFIALSALILIIVALATYKFAAAEKIHTSRANIAYKNELQSINQLLASYELSFSPVHQGCSKLDGDQSVFMNCYTWQSGQIEVNNDFISKWQDRSYELTQLLDKRGWQKAPNLDPVTKNPVDTLPRLLEYRGVYAADVTYTKTLGSTVCEIRFDVEPASQTAQNQNQLSITESCGSVAKNWL